ncbi:hypothetical protein NMG60_11025734 [Bertholletia excelsa]
MSFSDEVAPTFDKKLSTRGKLTSLNPNAAEFIPSALRSSAGRTISMEALTSLGASAAGTLGKAVLDQSGSSISNNSDDEAHQYWCHQLPDDIIPDFKVTGEEDPQGIDSIPFSTLSLCDGNETVKFSSSMSNCFMLKDQHELSSPGINEKSIAEKLRYSFPSYGEDGSSATIPQLPSKSWDKPIMNNDQLLYPVGEGHPHEGSGHGLMNEQAIAENTEINPIEFLATQFPGFAAESLAEVYFANGGDLNLTIEMLTQLELQVDANLNQNLNSKALSAPNLSALDFPALSVPDVHNSLPKYAEDDLHQSFSHYQSSNKDSTILLKNRSSVSTRSAIDFASAVRKTSTQDSGGWNYERNGSSAHTNVGSSRSTHVLASSYGGSHGKNMYGDKLQSRGSSRAAPVWLETGEAVANMYSEMREEARDHARLRNAYFEQARQAYLIGNKALAKELSVKGQLHNMQMKAAHGKAQESIYRLRNPGSAEMHGNGRGQERMIDLHGLHASEAIHVLKRELALLRSTARSAELRLQVYVCVGTGHHTRGARTPARLPIAVERFLLDEGLEYSEPQPGLLRVVVY